MSKKRTPDESNNDQQTNDGSDLAVFQPGDNAKRARLASLSDTTVQDLPVEILACILVKVVATEVNGMKLAKSVWKEKVDLVIGRLGTVCSQWSDILATNYFRDAVHRTLELAQKTIRMEILHQFPIEQHVFKVTTLKDEIFMISRDWSVVVYDRNNMAEVKDVVRQSEILAMDVASCVVSNCVYVLGLGQNTEGECLSVLRITKDAEHQFSVSPWISDLRLSFSILSVSANGNLIILSNQQGLNPAVLSMYNAAGFLQHKIMLPSGIFDFRHGANVLEKSNGNLVLVSHNDQCETQLTEIDMSGSIVRQYQSALGEESTVNFADVYGRILISDPSDRIELFDSEMNILNFIGPQLNGGQFSSPYALHYNNETNEVVGVYSQSYNDGFLTIFRFTEE